MCIRDSTNTEWYKTAVEAARLFLQDVPVDIQINQHSKKIIEENKKILSSIISCMTFSGTRDLPLRGKHHDEGVLQDSCRLRIDAGDQSLKNHFEKGKKNATYQSVQIQNEIISLCGTTIKESIFNKVKEACSYSLPADETADISGKEQLSIGLRSFDKESDEVKKEFIGFVELKALDAKTIAKAIGDFVTPKELDPEKCECLGFDGCCT